MDSYQDEQKDKELCNSVDGGGISRICLSVLEGLSINAKSAQFPEPIPEGMFPDAIAGVPVMDSKSCGPRLAFDGSVRCVAWYGSDALVMNPLVSVYIEEIPGSATSIAPDWRPRYADQSEATVSAELWPGGGKFLHYKGQMYESYFWYSGDRHVEVFFYHPTSERDEFVSYYMRRYPSTLSSQ